MERRPDYTDEELAAMEADDHALTQWEELTQELGQPLINDAIWARKNLDDANERGAPEHEIHAWRRTYVRAALASIEAMGWLYKRFVLINLELKEPIGAFKPDDFDRGEVAMLREEEYRVDGRGQVQVSSARTPFIDNVKFILRCLAKVHGRKKLHAPASPQMQALVEARKVRDRLMHPRSPASLVVTEAELKAIDEALEFWPLVEEDFDGGDDDG